MNKGKVYLVGAGPGDPKLITIRGLECIQQADVIIYDRLVNSELLDYAPKTAEFVFCGKFPNHHVIRQEAINQLLVEKACEGKKVTRLKGGDPCVFGRAGEEAEVLVRHHIPFEIVPGITAGIAASAYAGIPVTHRDYCTSFAMVTGHLSDEKMEDAKKWKALATGIDTIAFYMGMSNISLISNNLIKYGKDPKTPVAIIRWGTTTHQETCVGTLENIAAKVNQYNIKNPAIVLVGEVVNLRNKLQWFEEMVISAKAQ